MVHPGWVRRFSGRRGVVYCRRVLRPPSATPSRHAPARHRCPGGGQAAGCAYLTVTVAPAPSRAALALSAASLLTRSSTGFGPPSTTSLASLRPSLVRVLTYLMTWIFFSPAA